MSDSHKPPACPVDQAAAHRWFSVECFNLCWGLIDLPERSAEQEEEMLRLSMASHWHWTQRADCQPVNLAIAYWQLARVYALMGIVGPARHYATAALKLADEHDLGPFHVAYAHEALARAARIDADHERADYHLKLADDLLPAIEEEHDRNLIATDLEALKTVS